MVRAQAEMGGKHASMHGVNAPWGCAASSRSRARAPVDMRCANPYSSAERGRKVALWCGSGSQCLGAEDVPARIGDALAAELAAIRIPGSIDPHPRFRRPPTPTTQWGHAGFTGRT